MIRSGDLPLVLSAIPSYAKDSPAIRPTTSADTIASVQRSLGEIVVKGPLLDGNTDGRQLPFEDFLIRAANALGSLDVPVIFRDPSGGTWKMDKKCLRWAWGHGTIGPPVLDESGQLIHVRVIAPRPEAGDGWSSEKEATRILRAAELWQRTDQVAFRNAVLAAYGSACAISRTRQQAAIEAAHIRPIAEGGVNAVSNGLLLRRDIHALLDAFLITFSPTGDRFVRSARLTDPVYVELVETLSLASPQDLRWSPSSDVLTWHRHRFHQEEQKRQVASQRAMSAG